MEISKDGVAYFLWMVALALREADSRSREQTGNLLFELIHMHADSLVDGNSPYLPHRALSPGDTATVMVLQKFLKDAYEDGDLDLLLLSGFRNI